MSLFDDASLVLIPDGAKDGTLYSVKPTDGTGDFTFTRGSNLAATRVDENGLIEKGRENLLLQSNQFDTTWSPSSDITVTGGQTGYDGTSDAWLLKRSNASARYINQSLSLGQSVYTYSVYAKAESVDWLLIWTYDGSGSRSRYFDLANGVAGATVDGTIDVDIESVGNGWYRCSITYDDSIVAIRLYPAVDDGSITGGISPAGIYIQDAQLEQGLVATDYIETGATTAQAGILEDLPRIDYSGGASCPALLLEPQRTNLVPISEGVPEDYVGVTLTENYGTSPEGVTNSLKVQKYGVTENERIEVIDGGNATLVSGNDYTISAFVKNIDVTGVTTISCRVQGGTLFRQPYQWTGASLATSTSYQSGTRTNTILEDYGNGWWRIGFTFEADGTSGNFEIDIDRKNGNDTTSIETWGWQLEEGSYATSYIPTYGSSVTRSADVPNISSGSSIFNDSEGTFYVEIEGLSDTTSTKVITIGDGTSSNRVQIFYQSGTNITTNVISGGSAQVSGFTTSATQTDNNKVLIRYASNNAKMYLNGTEIASDTSVTPPSGLNVLRFDNGVGAALFEGEVKQLLYFPTALTDAECIALTTIA